MKRVNVINLHHKIRNISKAENVSFDISVEELESLVQQISDRQQVSIKLKEWAKGYTFKNMEVNAI